MALQKQNGVSGPLVSTSRLAAIAVLLTIAIIFVLYVSTPQVNSLSHGSPPTVTIEEEEKSAALNVEPDNTTLENSPPAANFPADVCHFIGKDPDAPDFWQFNSRALCLSSSVCLSSNAMSETYLQSSDLSKTECILDNPDFRATEEHLQDVSEFESCSNMQKELVLCAHGEGLHTSNAKCPEIRSTEGIDMSSERVRWFEDITILVPAYPYPGNIYHFGNVVAWIAHVVDALPTLLQSWGLSNLRAADGKGPLSLGEGGTPSAINIAFRSPKNRGKWQASLLSAILQHRISTAGRKVAVHYLPLDEDVEHFCFRNAVVLGLRGHVNVWPFPNVTAVPLDGNSVPSDAVDFKRAVYKAYNITARLPTRECTRDCVSELPPLTLGYAKRLSTVASAGGNVHYAGIVRRFNDGDEEWFTEMLGDETRAAGVKLHIFTTSGEDSLQAQVSNIVKVGFVVGIHGANLVNSIFMHPFGALLEIFPGKTNSPCYVAGSNSGLAYDNHVSSEVATPEESACRPDNIPCQRLYRQRMVKIGSEHDRNRIRELVRKGLHHLLYLHETYPDGIPTVYDKKYAYFVIDSSRDHSEVGSER